MYARLLLGPVSSLVRALASAGLAWTILTAPAQAVDPPYQALLERLTEVMGSLYLLQPLCGYTDVNWRVEAARLIRYELPDEDRRARLEGAFNEGYRGYARLYRTCTDSARLAMERFLAEGDRIAREIHSRYAE